MLDEVLNQIGRRQKFICTSHARPDGDAIGSTLACAQILRSMGKQANVVLSDGVPGIYRPLPYADSVLLDVEQAPEAEDPMDPGTRLEAGKPADIKESPGFAHPGIVTNFAPRQKPILAREAEAFRTLRGSKLRARFPEAPFLSCASFRAPFG